MTLYEQLAYNAEKYKDNTALTYFEHKIKYSELLKKADSFSALLYEKGIRKHDSIALMLPNTFELVISLYAANKIGARVVLINPKTTAEELAKELKMTGANMLIFSTIAKNTVLNLLRDEHFLSLKYIYVDILKNLPLIFKTFCLKKLMPYGAIGEIRKNVGDDNISAFSYRTGEVPICSDDSEEAVVIFSGGTSGELKGIVHTSASLNNSARSCANVVKHYDKKLSVLAILPAFHIFGLTVAIHFPIYSGGECVLVPFFHMNTIAKIVAFRCPNIIPGVPTIFSRILSSKTIKKYESKGKVDLSNFLWGICGGDYLSDELHDEFSAFLKRNNSGGYISMGYGMSECCPIAVGGPDDTGGCVGNVFMGCAVSINDCVDGSDSGEICVQSDYLMKKYFYEDGLDKYPELIDGKYVLRTKDIGHMVGDKLYYEYRLRRIIKVSGNTIFAGNIENVIESCECVKECHVVSVEHKLRGYASFAFVVLSEDANKDKAYDVIYKVCKNELIPYAIPVHIEFVSENEIDRTALDKVAYGILEKKARKVMNRLDKRID